MRIIGGDFKRKKLRPVPGANIRPTGAKLREAVFDILASTVPGARVLDLFAGTGALGLEALSRGAAHAVLIDADTLAITAIKENIRICGAGHLAQCIRWDIARNLDCIRADQPGFDLVFMDPPYGQELIVPALQNLDDSRSLKNGARVVVEHGARIKLLDGKPPPGFETVDRRQYGKAAVTFLIYEIG